MNIMYIHGFGSKFSSESNKSVALKSIGELYGFDYDTSEYANVNLHKMTEFANSNKIDIVLGTSLGGWYASQLGRILDIPFVSINPATEPHITLNAYEGEGIDYYNRKYNLSKDVIDNYWSFDTSGDGLVLLETGDEVIDYKKTLSFLSNSKSITTHVRVGGNHRYEGIKESLGIILKHYLDNVSLGSKC